jgi:superoxide dismutase, Fe-Mn family
MGIFSRRQVLHTLAIGGTALTVAGLDRTEPLTAQEKPPTANPVVATSAPPAFRGTHQPQPLTFDPAKLNGLSEKLVQSHWENNYGGAVKTLNAIEKKLEAMLKDKDLPPAVYGALKREELLRTGSVILHENYFGNLGGDGNPGGTVLSALKQSFGDYELWEADFKKTAAALGGGSGWVVLTYSLHNGEIHNYWSWDHMHNAAGGYPLLVLDMYEHSYHMDFGAAAAKYIDAFLLNVNWEIVDRRFLQAQKAMSVLRA